MAAAAAAPSKGLTDLLAGLSSLLGGGAGGDLPQAGGAQMTPAFLDTSTMNLPQITPAANSNDPAVLPALATAPTPSPSPDLAPAPRATASLPQTAPAPAPARSASGLPTPPVAPVHSWFVNALDKGVLGGGIAAHDAQVMHNANLAYQNKILSGLFGGEDDQGLPQQGQAGGGAPASSGTQAFAGSGAATTHQKRLLAATAYLAGKPEDAAKILAMKAQQLDNGDIIDADTGRLIGHGPKPSFQGHRVIDMGDASNIGQFFGEPPAPGAEPIYDSQRRPAGWKMADGSIQAISQGAGAKAVGEASTTFQEVPVGGSGQTLKMPTLDAVRLLGHGVPPPPGLPQQGAAAPAPAGQSPGLPQQGAPGAPAARPAGLTAPPQYGLTQSPAEKLLADKRVENQAKLESEKKGAFAAMKQVDDQTNMISQNLHDMLGETQNPNTGQWQVTKPSMINGWSTGSTTKLTEHAPFVSQPFHNLDAKAETVRSGTSFNSLQAIKSALEASGNGSGASVRMTDQISRMLGELNGALGQEQSPEQYEQTVRRHLAQLDTLNKARHDLFEAQYGGVQPQPAAYPDKGAKTQPAAPPGSLAERQAEARKRGLIP